MEPSVIFRTATSNGIAVDLDRPFERPIREGEPETEARKNKFEAQRLALQAKVKNGRLHPTYFFTTYGRIGSGDPNLTVLPHGFIRAVATEPLLDVSTQLSEVVIAAKMCGEFEMARQILKTPDLHFIDSLGFQCNSKFERDRMKVLVYRLIFGEFTRADGRQALYSFAPGSRTKEHEELLDRFPGFAPLHEDPGLGINHRIQVARAATEIALLIAREAMRTQHFRVVGFLQDDPLITYDGPDSQDVALKHCQDYLVERLQAWGSLKLVR